MLETFLLELSTIIFDVTSHRPTTLPEKASTTEATKTADGSGHFDSLVLGLRFGRLKPKYTR